MSTAPHGHLSQRESAPPASLRDYPSYELADELLRRVRSGQPLTKETFRFELFAILGFEIEAHLDQHENRFSRRYAANLFRMFNDFPRGNGLLIRGSTFLEVGCGSLNPMASLSAFVFLGAKRAIGIDLDPPQNPELAARAVARCAAWMLIEPRLITGDLAVPREEIARNIAETKLDLGKLWAGDPSGIDGDRLIYRQEDVHHLSLEDGAVDCIHSNSVLEHIPDVESAIAELARVTRRGGFGVHLIDGTDHLAYADPRRHPLAFLTVDSGGEEMVGECNRLRPLSFVPMFERHGFKVEFVHVHQRIAVDDELRSTFVEPFRSMQREDLEAAGAIFHLRRT